MGVNKSAPRNPQTACTRFVERSRSLAPSTERHWDQPRKRPKRRARGHRGRDCSKPHRLQDADGSRRRQHTRPTRGARRESESWRPRVHAHAPSHCRAFRTVVTPIALLLFWRFGGLAVKTPGAVTRARSTSGKVHVGPAIAPPETSRGHPRGAARYRERIGEKCGPGGQPAASEVRSRA